MKHLLLLVIRLYWQIIPVYKRNTCLFSVSCSHHVFNTATKKGFKAGLTAFWFRFKNCRRGSFLFINPVTKQIQMVLPNGITVIEREDISKYLLSKQNF